MSVWLNGGNSTGPLSVKEGAKMWICLFICLAIRTVHLELVKGLSTQVLLENLFQEEVTPG